MAVAPRDFTKGVFKLRSTVSGSLPTDDDLMKVVADGVPGTAMMGWSDLLSEAERRAIVAHVKTLSPRFAADTPQPVTLGPEIPATPAGHRRRPRRLRGPGVRRVSRRRRPATRPPSTRDFEDDWGKPLAPARLTEPWTFRGGSSAADIALRLKAGSTAHRCLRWPT